MIMRFLVWYLDRRYNSLYNDVDEDKMNEWLESVASESSGFRDYFKVRDITLLKSLGNGLTQKQYWIAVGRRMELLFLVGKASEQLKRSEDFILKKKKIK